MDTIIIFIMLICSGLFTGGVLTITWSRLPVWKKMDLQTFKTDFGHTIKITDRLQPILLIGTILSAGFYSLNNSDLEKTLALIATGGFAITFFASVIVLVPLQKRILSSDKMSGTMFAKWQQGHIGRTVLSLLSFFVLILSVSLFATKL